MTDFAPASSVKIEEAIEEFGRVTKLELPFPPSVNGMYFNRRGGRTKTEEYKNWLNAAGLMLNRQKPRPVLFRASVSIDLDDRRRGDADNRAKPVLDLLVSRGVLGGDSKKYVRRVSVGWEKLDGCRVTIREAA